MKTDIRIFGVIDENTALQFINDTDEIIETYCDYLEETKMIKKEFEQDFPPITLEISSEGGSVSFGNVILDRIYEMQSMGIKVDTYCRGCAYSMAFIIFLMGEERFGGQWCSFMNHASASQQQGYLQDMRNNIDFLQKMDDKFDELILEKTNMTKERLETARLKCDWITFEEAIDLGIINVFEDDKNEDENKEQ